MRGHGSRCTPAIALVLALVPVGCTHVCHVPGPQLRPGASPIAPAPLAVAVSVDSGPDGGRQTVDWGGGAAWILPLGAPIGSAFEDAASGAFGSTAAAPGKGEGTPDAVLSVRVTRYRALTVGYAEIDVDAALTARGGEELARAAVTGRSPKDAPWSLRTCPALSRAAVGAIGDAAARVRDALGASPRVAAWRAPRPGESPAVAAATIEAGTPRDFAGGGPAASAPPAAAARAVEPAPPVKIDLRPRVGELSDLRWAAARDAMVKERVDALGRRRLATSFMGATSIVGLAIAAKLAAGGDVGCGPAPCVEAPGHREPGPNVAAAGAVAAVSAALGIAAIAIWPSADRSITEVLALWNDRHPDEPLERAARRPAAPPAVSASDPE